MNPKTKLKSWQPEPPLWIMMFARLELLLKLWRGGLPVFAIKPLIQHLQAWLRLVEWNHVTGLVKSQEGEVAGGLDLSDLLVPKHVWSQLFTVEASLALPLKSVGPGLVSEPVANEVGITSID